MFVLIIRCLLSVYLPLFVHREVLLFLLWRFLILPLRVVEPSWIFVIRWKRRVPFAHEQTDNAAIPKVLVDMHHVRAQVPDEVEVGE